MESTARRKSATTAPLKKTSVRSGTKALTAVTPAAPVRIVAAPVAAVPLRPRGRPRKTAAELDDGNRRRELMDGAAKLFITKGFAATSTRDIAAAAGMHSGSPFYHFASKSALLFAVMSEGMTNAVQSQQAALDALHARLPDATPHECLRTLIRHHFEVLLGPRSGFIPVMLYESRSLTPVQHKSIARLRDGYEFAWIPTLEALHAQGALQTEPGVTRLFIFGALNWAVQWFSPKKGKSLDALTSEALALFVRHPHTPGQH